MHSPITVSIQGQQASFHEIAAMSYYDQPITLLYRDSFEEVFQDLITGSADKIFVATNNTIHGDIKEVEKLIKNIDMFYEGSYQLPIDQHLIGIPGANLSDISEVISHPIALSQCKKFFDNTKIKQYTYHDTAAAAEYVKQLANSSIAAIGSNASARLYGLKIIKEAIQDDPNNITTFQSFSLKS